MINLQITRNDLTICNLCNNEFWSKLLDDNKLLVEMTANAQVRVIPAWKTHIYLYYIPLDIERRNDTSEAYIYQTCVSQGYIDTVVVISYIQTG
jgi:hypothetical protein